MKQRWITLWIVSAFVLAACAPDSANPSGETSPRETESAAELEAPTPKPTLNPDDPPPAGAAREFSTDFSRHSVPYDEILSGGPPKDGIPALTDPAFVSVEEADEWLEEFEPVIFVQVGQDARAYPVQILIWHEIVNDTVGGLPLTVTFCPLCNTAIAFEREVNGQVLDFGTTGRLRNSNLIMYDRQTETWWQQGTGEAIVGELLGTQLEFYPAAIIAWRDFAASFPDGKVLSRETGFARSYGRNPYVGYDNINNSPFLYDGFTPDELRPMERVLAIEINGETVAYPYAVLEEVRVVNDVVGGQEIVVFWFAGVASGLDAGSVSAGRDVGTASAFSPSVDGELLTFSAKGERIFDDQTGSEWNALGQAIHGDLTGASLQPLTAFNHFWFDWVAFKPETRVFAP
ncbi:MAG: DUF3179 domain-containing protein [Anaerolineales bacterium]